MKLEMSLFTFQNCFYYSSQLLYYYNNTYRYVVVKYRKIYNSYNENSSIKIHYPDIMISEINFFSLKRSINSFILVSKT